MKNVAYFDAVFRDVGMPLASFFVGRISSFLDFAPHTLNPDFTL